MRKWAICLGASLLCGSAVTSAAAAPPANSCVAIQTSTPYQAAGYGHLATVQNNCERAVRCELWTDVDPQPHHGADLDPKASTMIAFRRDSPSRVFKVFAQCQYR
jgi:hypothetical protein